MAVGRPTPAKLQKLMMEFYSEDGRTIYIALEDNKIVGIIGMEYIDWPYGFIKRIAVHPDMQKQGVGRHLVNHVVDVLDLKHIGADIDQDAVGFYRACGFKIQEIESKYPSVQRFKCVKEIIKSK